MNNENSPHPPAAPPEWAVKAALELRSFSSSGTVQEGLECIRYNAAIIARHAPARPQPPEGDAAKVDLEKVREVIVGANRLAENLWLQGVSGKDLGTARVDAILTALAPYLATPTPVPCRRDGTDTRRLDWLEKRALTSHDGVPLDELLRTPRWCDLREAIDAAMSSPGAGGGKAQ